MCAEAQRGGCPGPRPSSVLPSAPQGLGQLLTSGSTVGVPEGTREMAALLLSLVRFDVCRV